MVLDLGIIEATEAKLFADPGYMALVDEAIGLMSATEPPVQMLMQLVHGDSDAANLPGSAPALGVSSAERCANTPLPACSRASP